MDRLGKYLTNCLVILLVVTSTILLTVNAQTIPKPSVPEFTLAVTEQNENFTVIEVTIKNQPYTSNGYVDVRTKIELLYNIQTKENKSSQWETISYRYMVGWLKQSSSDITSYAYTVNSSSTSCQIDFRVQAMLGSFYYNLTGEPPSGYSPVFTGETSDWSNTQSITIPDSSASVTPVPSSTNSQSSTTPTIPPDTVSDDSTLILFSIIIATLVISIISLLLYVRHLKRSKSKN